MRFAVTLLLFVIIGPTVAGLGLAGLFAAPSFGYPFALDELFAPVAGAGFAAALPVSIILAFVLTKRMRAGRLA